MVKNGNVVLTVLEFPTQPESEGEYIKSKLMLTIDI